MLSPCLQREIDPSEVARRAARVSSGGFPSAACSGVAQPCCRSEAAGVELRSMRAIGVNGEAGSECIVVG